MKDKYQRELLLRVVKFADLPRNTRDDRKARRHIKRIVQLMALMRFDHPEIGEVVIDKKVVRGTELWEIQQAIRSSLTAILGRDVSDPMFRKTQGFVPLSGLPMSGELRKRTREVTNVVQYQKIRQAPPLHNVSATLMMRPSAVGGRIASLMIFDESQTLSDIIIAAVMLIMFHSDLRVVECPVKDCNTLFIPGKDWQVYCSPACRKKAHRVHPESKKNAGGAGLVTDLLRGSVEWIEVGDQEDSE